MVCIYANTARAMLPRRYCTVEYNYRKWITEIAGRLGIQLIRFKIVLKQDETTNAPPAFHRSLKATFKRNGDAGPLDPMVELARVCWLFVQLHDDDLAELHNLPGPEKRAQQVRIVADGYGLEAARRKNLVNQIVEVIICETAHEAIDPGLNFDSVGSLWGFAWRTRSLYWVWRNRAVLEKALL